MNYHVEISDTADKDLREIYNYIVYELCSQQNAKGQLDRLEEAILSLEQFPARFVKYTKEPWYSRGLHVMTVDNYIVLYIICEETSVVTIIRVMYGGRDIEKALEKI